MPVIEFKPLEGRRLDEIELGVYDAMPCDVEPQPVVRIPRPANVLTARLEQLFAEYQEIARKKNADYANDENPFANFEGCTKYGVSVPKGMLVRMEDKMQRISNLLDHPEMVDGETILDTLADLSIYAAIMRAWIELKGQGHLHQDDPLLTPGADDYHGC